MNDAGRVTIIPKGNYSATTNYEFLDAVYYKNATYIAKKTTKGNTPAANSEYWQIMVGAGSVTGIKGENESEYQQGNVSLSAADVGAFPGSIKLANGTDLNDVKEPGVYYASSGTTLINSPYPNYAISLIVLKVNTAIAQLVFDASGRFAKRKFNTDKDWSEWEKNLPTVLTGDVTGTSVYNNSTGENVIKTTRKGCGIRNSAINPEEKPWFKVADVSISTTGGTSRRISFFVTKSYSTNMDMPAGILTISITTSSGSTNISYKNIYWNNLDYGINPDDFVLLTKSDSDAATAELWVKIPIRWNAYTFSVLSEGYLYAEGSYYTLYNEYSSGQPSYTEDMVVTVSTVNRPNDPWVDSLYPFTKIPDNSDLNDYTDIGTYVCISSASAKTLLNCPYTSLGFKLTVYNVYGSATATTARQQRIESRFQDVFYRQFYGNEWSDWIKIPIGIKGNNETEYRGGNVNLTSDDIGSVSLKPTAIIPANSDLNDYVNLGNYAIDNTAIAETIENTPFTDSGYMLIVLNTYRGSESKYRTQIAINSFGGMKFRNRDNSETGVWTNWKDIAKGNFEATNTTIPPSGKNAIGYAKWTADNDIALFNKDHTALYRQYYDSTMAHEIVGDYYTGQLAAIGKSENTWHGWRKIVDHLNFRNLIPEATKNGSGLMPSSIISLLNSPEMHRNIFRGKNLGTSYTVAQKAAIADGSFEDLYIGDYWIIGNITWRIADIDYWYNVGDTSNTKRHLVIIPDTFLYEAKMNDTNTTEGGYVNSKMRTTNLEQAKTIINNAFGSGYILNHRELLIDAVTDGIPSNTSWYDSTVELPNEIMMYGSYIFTPGSMGIVKSRRQTIDKTQLALMRLNPKQLSQKRQKQWLRDPSGDRGFSYISNAGDARFSDATYSYGVRPVFGLIGA